MTCIGNQPVTQIPARPDGSIPELPRWSWSLWVEPKVTIGSDRHPINRVYNTIKPYYFLSTQGDADLTPHTGVSEEETRKFGLFLMPVKNTESDQREIDCVFVVFGRDSDGQPTGHSLRDSYVYQPNTQIGYGEPDLLKDESNSQSYIQNDEVRDVF